MTILGILAATLAVTVLLLVALAVATGGLDRI